MANTELCFLSIAQMAEQLQKKAVSPVELTHAYLDRIAAVDRQLNSYLTVTADRALQEAKRAEAEILANSYRGPLHGIPLAHKDIVATKGIATTCASKVLQNNIPDYDAMVIERLQSAGSILLGKLNMNEFATMLPSLHFGRVNNPWNHAHSPGGSSSGSGAAVAAGLCAGSLGTDTGGLDSDSRRVLWHCRPEGDPRSRQPLRRYAVGVVARSHWADDTHSERCRVDAASSSRI